MKVTVARLRAVARGASPCSAELHHSRGEPCRTVSYPDCSRPATTWRETAQNGRDGALSDGETLMRSSYALARAGSRGIMPNFQVAERSFSPHSAQSHLALFPAKKTGR
jgi:hypothetical protein